MLLARYGMIKRYQLNVLKMGKIKDRIKKSMVEATRKAIAIPPDQIGKVAKSGGIIAKMTPEQVEKAFKHRIGKPKTVIKAAVKPKVLEQTPTGMANSTKSSPYIPPAKVTKKCKL